MAVTMITLAMGPAERPPVFRRSGFARRSGFDRRQAIDLDVLDRLGKDRRQGRDRRRRGEKRAGWIRITPWSSVFVGQDIQFRIEVTGTSRQPQVEEPHYVI